MLLKQYLTQRSFASQRVFQIRWLLGDSGVHSSNRSEFKTGFTQGQTDDELEY